jgi:thiol:disulfide interchange protein DsbG
MSILRRSSKQSASVLSLLLAALVLGSSASARADLSTWQKLQRSTWVSQGPKNPHHLIYVVMDPNCPYCHDLWTLLRARYAKGLQVRYVMVGFIAANSPGKAAAILEAPNPSQALDENELNWGDMANDMGGGIKPKNEMTPDTGMSLMVNEQLIRSLGVEGTPALIYEDRGGHTHVVQSVPSEHDIDVIVSDSPAA